MIKHYCDRCGREIENEIYFITISSDSLTSLNGYNYRQTIANDCQNMNAHLNIPREYCKDCRDDINNYMNKEVEK